MNRNELQKCAQVTYSKSKKSERKMKKNRKQMTKLQT